MPDMNQHCKSCEYYETKAQECHRYAPRPVDLEQQKKVRWPFTAPIGWCGEFKAGGG